MNGVVMGSREMELVGAPLGWPALRKGQGRGTTHCRDCGAEGSLGCCCFCLGELNKKCT